jgi:hypothetical protein
MKNILLLSFLAFCFSKTNAQTNESKTDLETVVIWQLGKVKFDKNFPYDKKDFFKEKIRTTLAKSGTVVEKYGTGVIDVSIQANNDIVDVGLKKMATAQVTVLLIAKDLVSGNHLASTEVNINGSGNDRSKAYQQAIRNFKNKHSIKKFMRTGTENYSKYISENCTNFLQESDKQAKLGNLNQALSILIAIPSTADCFAMVDTRMGSLFKQIQLKNCNEIIIQTKSQIAAGSYEKGVRILSRLRGDAPCIEEAKQLTDQIRTNYQTERTAELDALKTAWANPLSGMSVRQSALMYLSE